MNQFEELQNSYKQLELKYKQLVDHEEHSKNDQISLVSSLNENEQLKQKNAALENELLTLKSIQSHHQDLQINIERLQTEIQLSVSPCKEKNTVTAVFSFLLSQIKERETASMLNTQLRNEITNLTNTNERVRIDNNHLSLEIILIE